MNRNMTTPNSATCRMASGSRTRPGRRPDQPGPRPDSRAPSRGRSAGTAARRPRPAASRATAWPRPMLVVSCMPRPLSALGWIVGGDARLRHPGAVEHWSAESATVSPETGRPDAWSDNRKGDAPMTDPSAETGPGRRCEPDAGRADRARRSLAQPGQPIDPDKPSDGVVSAGGLPRVRLRPAATGRSDRSRRGSRPAASPAGRSRREAPAAAAAHAAAAAPAAAASAAARRRRQSAAAAARWRSPPSRPRGPGRRSRRPRVGRPHRAPAARHRTLSRRHAQSGPARGRRAGLDLLDRRRHGQLFQRPPLHRRGPRAAARRGAGRGDDQLFRLRL